MYIEATIAPISFHRPLQIHMNVSSRIERKACLTNSLLIYHDGLHLSPTRRAPKSPLEHYPRPRGKKRPDHHIRLALTANSFDQASICPTNFSNLSISSETSSTCLT